MAPKKTQLLDITSITGIATVVSHVGVTATAGGVGVASSYIKNIIMHNTGWDL